MTNLYSRNLMPSTLPTSDIEIFLQALIRSHGEKSIILTFDPDCNCLTITPAQGTIFEIPTDKIIGQNLHHTFTPDITAQIAPHLLAGLQGKSSAGDICNLEEKYALLVEPLDDEDGKTIGGLAIIKPLSTSQQESPTNSLNYWNALWSVLPDMLFRLTRDGVFIDYRTSQTTGLYISPQEFLGKKADEILPEILATRVHNALSTLFDTGIPVTFRYDLPDEAGQTRFFEARFVRVSQEEALVIVRDITEQFQHEAAIRHSERRFRQLTETAVDLIATHDLEGNFLYVNPAGITMLGLDPDVITSYNIERFITPESSKEVHSRQVQRNEGDVSKYRYEIDVITTDNQLKTLDVSSSLIIENDIPKSVLLIARDISERKRTEKQLISQANQIELYLQNTHDGLLICKRGGTILDANPAYCAMSGRSRESLIGININDLTDGLTEGELALYRQQVDLNGSTRFRARHRHLDGHLLDMEISVYLVSDEDERLYIFLRDTTAENIALTATERTAKRLAILHNIDAGILSAQNEEAIAEATLNHIQQLIVCYTSSIMIFDWDDRVAEVIASYLDGIYKSDQKPTIPFDHLPPMDDLMAGKSRIVQDMATVQLQNSSFDRMRSMGIQSYITVPIRADGRLLGGLTLTHLEKDAFSEEDVLVAQEVAQSLAIAIHQVRLHQQIRLYAEELGELVNERTGELRSANERLMELDHLKSKFVSDVSHELRTPVNNLTMRLHLLEHDEAEQQSVHLEHVKNQVGYLSKLVEDILQISRLEVDKSAITFYDLDINVIVKQVYDDYLSMATSRKISLLIETGSALPIVIGDQTGLSQVIHNLVANAFNYTEHGKITLRTRYNDRIRHVVIEVEDTGKGIDPADKPHIFDRFYRGSSVAKSENMGTGLGLAIANEIIQVHGGRIEVESELGKGSRFTVWLPALLEH